MKTVWIANARGKGVLEFVRGAERQVAPAMISSRYEIDGILARGGFGVVYTARDRRLAGRRVLVKARRHEPDLFLYPDDDSRADRITRARQQTKFEAQCLLSFRSDRGARAPNLNDYCIDRSPELSGPHRAASGHIWSLNDTKLISQEPYLIMQAIEGESVADFARHSRGKPWWERWVLQLGLELSTILNSLHRPRDAGHFFIYQDLKPDNILVSHGQFFTLIDFGAVTLVRPDADGVACSSWDGFGSPGTATKGYKAPELDPRQRQLSRLDQRVDIYGLGATLWSLLSGVDPASLDEWSPLSLDAVECKARATRRILMRALAEDRAERYQTMNDLKDEIFQAFRELKAQ